VNHPTAVIIRHTSAIELHGCAFLNVAAKALVRELILQAYVARLEEAVRAAYGYTSMVALRAFDEAPPGPCEQALLNQRFLKAHGATSEAMHEMLAAAAADA
jgi:hypothetical protein